MVKQSLFLLMLALGGCSTGRLPTESYFLGKYHFGYVTSGIGAKAITQVFDDGANTFLQMAESAKSKPITISHCDKHKPLKVEVNASYIIVPGIHFELCAILGKNRINSALTISKIEAPMTTKSTTQ